MKRLFTMMMAAMMVMAMTMTSFAAGWQQNENGWWYATNDDGTAWYANEWQWIDGNGDGVAESYYFDQNGYLLTNTTTPDGYTVNADGAWTKDGVVQTQGTVSGAEAEAHPTSQEILNRLSQYENGTYDKTPRFTIDTSRPAVSSGVTNIKYTDIMFSDAFSGWLWHDFRNNKGLLDLCAVALDADGYLYVNTTTPDGYYVNEYGFLEVNGIEVTHNRNCCLAITLPYEGSYTLHKNGTPIQDKNHADDVDISTTLGIDSYEFRIIPFGNLVYNHYESTTDRKSYFDDNNFGTCIIRQPTQSSGGGVRVDL